MICYNYLWSHEHRKGLDDGEKNRPSLILSVVGKKVTVAPITSLAPAIAADGIEIPSKVQTYLGLHKRSWIIVTELNDFDWPGQHLFPVPRGRPGQYDYGLVPLRLFDAVKTAILKRDAEKKAIARRDR